MINTEKLSYAQLKHVLAALKKRTRPKLKLITQINAVLRRRDSFRSFFMETFDDMEEDFGNGRPYGTERSD